jgi:hypothetical protein
MASERLTLREATETGRLREFSAQEEARGVGLADRELFDAAIRQALKRPRSGDRTLRSASRDGSPEG